MPPADPSVEWLSRASPFEVFAWLAGAVMLVIALAQWLASYRADRRALRIFAFRYVAAGAGWWFAHPERLSTPQQEVPLGAALVGVALLGITVWALDEFLGWSGARRRAAIAAGTAAGAAAVVLYGLGRPGDPAGIYGVMVLATAFCAGMAWRAARSEPGVGHVAVAAAFATYPLLMLVAAAWSGWQASANLSYLVALPATIVGVTILAVSLLRAARRTEAELRARQAAETRLAELNASLEQRVVERTAELQLLVDGLEAFARTVSHDLRGSLGGVAQLSRLAIGALARGEAATTQRYLEVMAPHLEHMTALVSDLLTLTRLNAAPVRREVQPLAPLVQHALDQAKLEPEVAATLGRVDVEVGELPSLPVDATLLRQVFVNLLTNALRFAGGSGCAAPKVTVGWAAPRGGEPPAVFVADNGPGFAPEAAGELFHPFACLHAGTPFSRHGIGLSIVRKIVERHGGRVWAEGRPGHGAIFWFSLPPPTPA